MARDLVTVATFSVLLEAESMKLRFEDAGIPCFLADTNIVTNDWFLGNAVGQIKLQVPTEHVEVATELWERICAVRKQRALQGDAPDVNACLACGALMPEDASTCVTCGWTFASGDGDDNTSNA